ncbi:hypothetical protein [Cellulomonas sp. URHE0023]|uniref:hypothetical protein n=1 Tax=Cellulomonas sp. URHE0023 TaxID=1380354 RepID=UPI00069121D4|nr:hypothetical protein [Cellulomonas sp. URHE0023]
MPAQVAVCVQAELVADREQAARDFLAQIDVDAFDAMGTVHFARAFILDRVVDTAGRPIPSSVVYMADVDGSADGHFRALPPDLQTLFGHCVGYPTNSGTGARLRWLHEHSLRPAAYYRHTADRPVDQIRREAYLREQVEIVLDELPDARRTSVDEVTRTVYRAMKRRPDLSWAIRRPASPGLAYGVLRIATLVALAGALLFTLPVVGPFLVAWVLVVRFLELHDAQESGAVDVGHIEAVRRHEDHGVQNPFTGVGFVKPGIVRRLTMRGALLGLDLAFRLVMYRNSLSGVRTIHFARWQPVDGGRRFIFASAYDGNLESYMDDFISRLAWGINLVFGNGVGFPRTRWLFFGGAKDEIAYKHYLRRHLVPTEVFYSAYPTLAAIHIDRNADVRRALRAQDRRWLQAM